MERMGPEALMVLSRTAPRLDGAEYARLEYAYEDIRAVVAGLAVGADEVRAGSSAIGSWVLRAQVWLRGKAAPDVASAADALAALPAVAAGGAPEGEPMPVWAIPVLLRGPPDRSP
ncbi:MAG: hypothetical protein WB789_00050 [Thermoplasmata archaeon]|jgi:hypothetical protein